MENSIFTTCIPVQVEHLNYGNHLGYHAVFLIIQEARMRWLNQYGMKEMNLDGSVGYLITSASAQYKAEAFHLDNLEIIISAGNIKAKAFDLNYEIKNISRNNMGAILTTTHVCYDFLNKKVANVPKKLLDIIGPVNRP